MSTEGGFLLFPHTSFLSISDRVMRLPLPPLLLPLLTLKLQQRRSCHYKYNPADKVEIMIINQQQMCFKRPETEEEFTFFTEEDKLCSLSDEIQT